MGPFDSPPANPRSVAAEVTRRKVPGSTSVRLLTSAATRFPASTCVMLSTAIGFTLLYVTTTALGQAVPKVASLWPQWVERGATTVLVVEGENLMPVTGFIFNPEGGITATREVASARGAGLEASRGGIVPADTDEKALRISIVVAADAVLGPREFRVVTPNGVSTPATLNVGFLREITEDWPTGSSNEVRLVELPAAISGRIQEPAETDSYRFKARKGERLIFDVSAFRAGSALDSSLAVLDLSGKELTRNEDATGLDSLIDFPVPADGEYVLQIRDFRYQGGKDFRYRIVAGELPYLDSIFPLGGQRGQPVEVSLEGRNLDGLSKMKVRVESDAPLGQQEVRTRTARGYSNPVIFAVGEHPESLEQEPNNAPTNANAVKVPMTVNGRIGTAKDIDQFRVPVEKNQTLIFELFASRFGSPLDGVLILTDQGGKVIQENDDAAGADARIERTFPEAGEYRVRVRDLLNRGGGSFGYRLVIRPPKADFMVKFSPDSLRISRGSHAVVRVEAQRLEGFDGSLEVSLDGLPAGVTAEALVIPPDSAVSPMMVLSAGEDAPLGDHRIRLVAAGIVGGERVQRKGRPQSDGRTVQEAFLTILDRPAFTIDPITVSARVDQNQATTLECRVHRHGGFAGEVQVMADGFSAGTEPLTRNVELEPVTLKSGDTRVLLTLKARAGSETGSRMIVFKGEATLDGQKSVQYSRPIPLTIDSVPFTLVSSLSRLAVTVSSGEAKSAASEAEFTIKATRRGWFADDISLVIEGLPEGINVNTTNIARGAGEAAFKLTATDKAPVGKEISLTVVGKANVNGRNSEYRVSPITVTVTAPEAPAIPAATTSAAK